MRIPFHPSNYQFLPPLSDNDYEALKADIAARGIMVPIEYDQDGNVLDGYHRLRICDELGISEWPRVTRTFASELDKHTHARQLNLARRHLNQEQRRTLIADELRERPERSNNQIAQALGVSDTTVGTVRSQLESTSQIGKLETTVGADGKARPAKRPPKIVALDFGIDGAKATTTAAKSIRARKAADRHADSIKRIAEISKGTRGLPSGQRYPLIYADPAWYFAAYDSVTGNARNPEGHYPCMRTEDICAMPVRELATNDAVLFLWTTAPHLEEAFRVIDAWGFRYASNIVWVKDQIGLGFYVRNQHELLLIATRGDIPCPLPANRPASVIEAPRREHSRKPDAAYELIERMYPELPKIELFARGKREGWAAWGNQAAPPDDGLDIPESLRRVAP